MDNVSHSRYWLNNRQISLFDVNVANLINLVYCLIQNSPVEASKSGRLQSLFVLPPSLADGRLGEA